MDHGCACSPFTLITIRPIDDRQRLFLPDRDCIERQALVPIRSVQVGVLPTGAPHARLITPVTDRPGHDRRYAIDPSRISSELGWQPRHSFEAGLEATVRWYLEQKPWCDQVREQGGYSGGRLGVLE